ncbi:hypothetical protein [Arthrobacter sp.]|uniref:hypothetical protein n=1 Tax=Arthrobacter sp. TaxID=1667 RepID=UPI0026DEB2C8|nr:hypothetical protein [Arthrobacter sp.]MDO5751502.1 hypothetical protein [Arthrobacter sp.]
MIAALQWTALGTCFACTVWRVPSMVKGRNRGLFWVCLLASVCVALSIPALYLPIDALLGEANLANVILRFSSFAVFYLMAVKVAAAYDSSSALRLIRGPIGFAVIAVCSSGILATYFFTDFNGSSPGLVAFGDQPLAIAYMWFGMSYPAYASACLVQPTAKAALSNRRMIDRAAASCLCIGFFLIFLTIPLKLLQSNDGFIVKLVSFGSILFVATGFVIVWLSFIRKPMQGVARS